MKLAIPIEHINSRRWSLIVRVLTMIQENLKEKDINADIDFEKLRIEENKDINILEFIYDEENKNSCIHEEIDFVDGCCVCKNCGIKML
jgi:hypothetical protein